MGKFIAKQKFVFSKTNDKIIGGMFWNGKKGDNIREILKLEKNAKLYCTESIQYTQNIFLCK